MTDMPKYKLPLYHVWRQMIYRTINPNNRAYHNYGGRGIVVCDGYKQSFMKFEADLGEKPSINHSVDRRDNNGGYWCGTCEQCLDNGWARNIRWANRSHQAINQRVRSNRSGYHGISYYNNLWYGEVKSAGIRYRTRGYKTLREAVYAYNKIARRYHGSLAKLHPVA